jgi:hypothetical protein
MDRITKNLCPKDHPTPLSGDRKALARELTKAPRDAADRRRAQDRHARHRQGRSGRRRVIDRGWQRAFDDPIQLPDGRTLVTLHDAATYITGLPKKEAAEPEWQAAIEALMLVADRGGPPCLLGSA